MKRRKSPRLKKQDEYDKDHRTLMENPHAFRKNWPKKKARANRKTRRRLEGLLRTEDATSSMAKATIRPKAIRKCGVKTLRGMIQWKRNRAGVATE